jgi:hypothetical protein
MGMLRGRGVSIGKKLLRFAALGVVELGGTRRLFGETAVAGKEAFRALFEAFRSMVGDDTAERGPMGIAPNAPVVEIRMSMRGEVEG